ncbi:Ras-like GTP-binding protein RhoL [Folsomia candida]|uniref:Ras-like GTP-binding protein RhoL n=1 Tax=Folsomia candida TaxID=158441 RepID=A0A226E339_FOLCA|nr:Ras-like GTP-binding protein RhoL [Folsomia candida]
MGLIYGWDTAGQEEYARLRPLSYPKTDCFIVCYAIDNPTSFGNVKTLWIPEVRKYCPRAAVVLVGTKLDLKESGTISTLVELAEAKKLKHKIGAQFVLECSAKTRENLEEVFTRAILAVIKKRSANKSARSACVLL